MEVFEGPQLTPPRISLLSAADIVPMNSDRWTSGFDLILEGCEDTRVYAVCPPDNAAPKLYTGGGTNQAYKPYVLYATDKCSTWPAQREFYDRAQRRLLTGESAVLEEQLWTGSVSGTAFVNPSLASEAVTISTPVAGVEQALVVLEQAMGMASAARGMIHIRPQVLGVLLNNNIVRQEGNVYLSPMNNIVVPGRGYPGTGPAGQAVGAKEWMYGHPGIVQVRRGPVIRLGEDDKAGQYNRLTNDRLVIVERVVHVALDDACVVYAINFNSLGPITFAV